MPFKFFPFFPLIFCFSHWSHFNTFYDWFWSHLKMIYLWSKWAVLLHLFHILFYLLLLSFIINLWFISWKKVPPLFIPFIWRWWNFRFKCTSLFEFFLLLWQKSPWYISNCFSTSHLVNYSFAHMAGQWWLWRLSFWWFLLLITRI